MAKESELWDDSALIKAFDRAISTYKVMHGMENKDNSAEKKGVTESTEEIDSENLGTKRDADEKSSVPANASGSGETSNASYLEENNRSDSLAAQPCLDSLGGYPQTQGFDDYNRLVSQYYELEGQRQKILEQLNQYGGWNYQYPAADSNAGVPYSNSQDYSMSACHVSDSSVPCSCCPCCSQCLLPPCTSVPFCSTCIGKPCNDYSQTICPGKSFPHEDDKILKTAMGAAEKAMSTIRTTINGQSDKKEEKEKSQSELDQHNGSETDLTVVLNAWYSAGFYTGKYLTEQSIANRRQG